MVCRNASLSPTKPARRRRAVISSAWPGMVVSPFLQKLGDAKADVKAPERACKEIIDILERNGAIAADISSLMQGIRLRRDRFRTSMPEYNDAFSLPGLR